jgi:hypothetical protein
VVAGQPVHLENEVILQEEEAHNGEEVNKDEGQQGSQQDGTAIAGHTLDDIEQCLLTVDKVKELQDRDDALRGWARHSAWGLPDLKDCLSSRWIPQALPSGICAQAAGWTWERLFGGTSVLLPWTWSEQEKPLAKKHFKCISYTGSFHPQNYSRK